MMNATSTRALIFYGDITGFSSWSRRVRRERVRDLIRDTYDIYDRWQGKHGYWMKRLSDGMIAAVDLAPKNDRHSIILALRAIHELSRSMNRYLAALTFPRPANFRLRGVLGDAWRFDDLKGEMDYAGDPMDFGRRLLDVAKDELLIVSEGVFDGIGRKSCQHIVFRELRLGDLNLIGVHPEEQRRFWSYRFCRKRR